MENFQNPSIILRGAGKAAVEDRPIPQIEDAGDVLVRIAYVGVCGSDVHFWARGGIGNNIASDERPFSMGHEACGIIHQVGSAVTHLKPGDKVAIEPMRPCRTCVRCKEGSYNFCPSLKFAASCPEDPGALCRFFLAPADFCYKLGENTSLIASVLAEPLAVAVHAVRAVNIRPDDTVLICGAGTIGILSAIAANHYGAQKIFCIDINDKRLEMSKEVAGAQTLRPTMGATAADNAARMIKEAKLLHGFDAVIETSGVESSINIAIHTLRYGGQMVQTGLGKPTVNIAITELTEKEIHLHGAARYCAGDFAIAMDLLNAGRISYNKLITGKFPFEETTAAWEATRNGVGIKNIIVGLDFE